MISGVFASQFATSIVSRARISMDPSREPLVMYSTTVCQILGIFLGEYRSVTLHQFEEDSNQLEKDSISQHIEVCVQCIFLNMENIFSRYFPIKEIIVVELKIILKLNGRAIWNRQCDFLRLLNLNVDCWMHRWI